MIRTKGERRMSVAAHIVMVLLSLFALIPFWLLVMGSITDNNTAVRFGYKFLPSVFSLDAYAYIGKNWGQIGRAYGVTAVVTTIGTFASVLLTAMFAYGLLQQDVRGTKLIGFLVLLTMLFNGGIVPQYYIYSRVLQIRNTIWGLLLPNLLMSGFSVILVRNFIRQNVPRELSEAAEIDGAGQFSIFFRIVIPLSTPILATVGLLNAIAYWNDWTNGLYYITNDNLYSIQQLLNEMNENIMFLANYSARLNGIATNIADVPTTTVRMAIAVVAIVPIIIAYPFFHKYFAKGITLGAVKG